MAETISTLRVRALHDYWAFIDLLKFKGGTSSFGSVHEDLVRFVTQPQTGVVVEDEGDVNRRLVMMPRGHLKSTVCSVGYVLWRIYRNPGIRIVVGTAEKKLSLAFIRELKQYLEDETLQQRVWNNRPHISGRLIPVMDTSVKKRRNQKVDREEEAAYTEAEDKKVVWRADAIQVLRDDIMKEPTVWAVSVGTTITGDHADLLILDDIVTFKNVRTPQLIAKTREWAEDMESVLDPQRETTTGTGKNALTEQIGDEVLCLGTRYAKGDYWGFLLGEKDGGEEDLEVEDRDRYQTFIRNIYVNGENDNDGYLWPERFNAEVLRKKKATLRNPRKWASQYLNRIISDEEQVFKKDLVQYIHFQSLDIKDGVVEIRFPNTVTPVVVRPVLVVDPAISQASTADNTCLMVGGLDHEQNLYVFDAKVGRFTPSQTIDHVFTLADKWKLHGVTIENVGFQASLCYSLRDEMRKRRPLVIREYKPHGLGRKEDRIIAALEPIFANSKIYMTGWMAQVQQLMEEIEFFGASGIKDDCLDAMSVIVQTAVATPKRKPRVFTQAFNSKYGGVR
jgi:hypothetical protein